MRTPDVLATNPSSSSWIPGVFDHGRYWAVDVTYAKASPTEILAKITIEEPRP